METALRWLADHTPGSAEMLRLMDATPVPCGHSVITANRSDLYGWAGYGYCPAFPLVLGSQAAADLHLRRTVTGFALANPKLFGEREEGRQILERQPANGPAPPSSPIRACPARTPRPSSPARTWAWR